MKKTALVAALGIALFAAGCKKKKPCPAKYSMLSAAEMKGSFECDCSGKEVGMVWGDGIYTADSNVCRAAVHAGALAPGKAGSVKILPKKGCGAYSASNQNGVNSGKWGSFSRSFVFEGMGKKCPPASLGSALKGALGSLGKTIGSIGSALKGAGSELGNNLKKAAKGMAEAANKTISNAARALGSALGNLLGGKKTALKPGECPRRWKDVPDYQTQDAFGCTCFKTSGFGSVWGSKVYTADSNICKAALHAGAVPAAGGKVNIKRGAGCDKYSGSAANGVTSRGWSKYPHSFYFVGHGTGKCM